MQLNSLHFSQITQANLPDWKSVKNEIKTFVCSTNFKVGFVASAALMSLYFYCSNGSNSPTNPAANNNSTQPSFNVTDYPCDSLAQYLLHCHKPSTIENEYINLPTCSINDTSTSNLSNITYPPTINNLDKPLPFNAFRLLNNTCSNNHTSIETTKLPSNPKPDAINPYALYGSCSKVNHLNPVSKIPYSSTPDYFWMSVGAFSALSLATVTIMHRHEVASVAASIMAASMQVARTTFNKLSSIAHQLSSSKTKASSSAEAKTPSSPQKKLPEIYTTPSSPQSFPKTPPSSPQKKLPEIYTTPSSPQSFPKTPPSSPQKKLPEIYTTPSSPKENSPEIYTTPFASPSKQFHTKMPSSPAKAKANIEQVSKFLTNNRDKFSDSPKDFETQLEPLLIKYNTPCMKDPNWIIKRLNEYLSSADKSSGSLEDTLEVVIGNIENF